MKARPILFSGPMVRAILDGRKVQTRRIVRPQPFNGASDSEIIEQIGGLLPDRSLSSMVQDAWETGFVDIPCPYGKPGDVLWVREAFSEAPDVDHDSVGRVLYSADGESYGKRKPSIFMPRSYSRITLEIESIRVERLQGISEADAIAEGIERIELDTPGWHQYRNYLDDNPSVQFGFPQNSFRSLWESINGPESWSGNPWVWCISFSVIRKNIDEAISEKS